MSGQICLGFSRKIIISPLMYVEGFTANKIRKKIYKNLPIVLSLYPCSFIFAEQTKLELFEYLHKKNVYRRDIKEDLILNV